MAYPNNQDDEPGFVFLEDDPIGPDAETIKSFFRAAEPPDVVLECRRISGQNQELGLDDFLPRSVDFFKLIPCPIQKHKLIHSDPQVFPNIFGIDEFGLSLFDLLQTLSRDLKIQEVKIDR